MKTKKPFSSISYNTDEHLTHVLNKWLKSGDIVFWAYINHKGEGQSQHPKDHKHVYIEPNKPILTTDFTESTMEFDYNIQVELKLYKHFDNCPTNNRHK